MTLFVLLEVNRPSLAPQSQLTIFACLGLVIGFLSFKEPASAFVRWTAFPAAVCTVAVGVYLVLQTEPTFQRFWIGGRSLGDRAGIEGGFDIFVGVVGLLLVLEAARRAVGWALPILALVLIAYAFAGPSLPDWLLPHRGYGVERIVAQTFLQSQGVFGIALRVMFSYVFLFVAFGAILEATGATEYVLSASRRLLGRTVGGPAKVAVMSSGLMGSLSGSAVANTATTGVFTIPMMRSSGFRDDEAAGIEAAASSGGALVPPVMGAGAYMMLEVVTPPVTYLEIVRAALLPAILYYLSLFLIVHFSAGRSPEEPADGAIDGGGEGAFLRWEGTIFFAGLGTLIWLLVSGFTVFRAVSIALGVVLATAALRARTRLSLRRIFDAFVKAARGGVPLVAAASAVGIVIGVVTLTGVGTKLPRLILPLAEQNLVLALIVIMASSLLLGMGLPSAVCYLLMATLIGPVLGDLGVVPLAAHFFIFYFGMMSMVTPPVALAAYTASAIAGSSFLKTSLAAFRCALIGFALPYLFVFEPALLMLDPSGAPATVGRIAQSMLVAVVGVVPLSIGLAGRLHGRLPLAARGAALLAALLLLWPSSAPFALHRVAGAALLFAIWFWRRRVRRNESTRS